MSGKRTGSALGRSEREAIRRVRAQAKLVAQLGERLSQLDAGGPGGMWRDGSLTGGGARSGAAAGLDKGLILKEELTRAAKRERAELTRMRRRAQEALGGVRPELYAFCMMYYVSGMEMEQVMQVLDRSERQCMRYKREIEEDE